MMMIIACDTQSTIALRSAWSRLGSNTLTSRTTERSQLRSITVGPPDKGGLRELFQSRHQKSVFISNKGLGLCCVVRYDLGVDQWSVGGTNRY